MKKRSKYKLLILSIFIVQIIVTLLVSFKRIIRDGDLINISITKQLIFTGQIQMFNPYQGINLFLIPFLFIHNEFLLYKIASTFFLILGNLLFYLAISKIYNKKIALFSLIFIGFNLIYTGISLSELPFMPFFISLFIFLGFKIYKEENKNYYHIGLLAFFIGFSLFFKLTNLYILIALTGASLIFFLKKIIFFIKKHIKLKHMIIFLIFFSIGISPLIIANIHGFPTLYYLKDNFVTNDEDYSNANLGHNIITRINQFNKLFSKYDQNIINSIFTTQLFPFLIYISIIIILFIGEKKDKFFALSSIIFSFLILFLPGNPSMRHFLPFVQIFLLMPIILVKLTQKKKYLYYGLIIILIIILLKPNIGFYFANKDLSFFEIKTQEGILEFKKVYEKTFQNDTFYFVGPTRLWDVFYKFNHEIKNRQSNMCNLNNNKQISECYNYLNYLKNPTNRKIIFIFATQKRNLKKDLKFECSEGNYNESICVKQLSIFINNSNKYNYTPIYLYTINDSINQPFVDIYTIK